MASLEIVCDSHVVWFGLSGFRWSGVIESCLVWCGLVCTILDWPGLVSSGLIWSGLASSRLL